MEWFSKIGLIAADNGVHYSPLSQIQLNVLALYAVTLGTLLAQKRSQIAVRESEKHLRLLAQNSPDFIYILSLNEVERVYLNREEFLGYSRSEMQGVNSPLRAVHPTDSERVSAHWQALTTPGEHQREAMIEYRLSDKDGQWHWVQSRETTFASDTDGKPTQILVTLTDITERKQYEAQTLELATERSRSKIMERFIHDMSHDFRTPLSTINTSLYLLKKSTDPEKQAVYITRAEQHVHRMDRLLEELLQMERLDKRDTSYEFGWADLNV